MKNLIFNMILSLIILVLSGCKQDNAPVPLKFKAFNGNPILTPGEPGSWDDLLVMNACVLEYDDTIYLFYTGYKQNMIKAVGLVISIDGFHFTKYHGNPVLEADQTGFDAYGVSQAEIIREDSNWVLYYNARETAGFGMGPSIGRATSPKLTGPWTRSENPVLMSGRMGEWDAEFIQVGPVLHMNDNSYVMYYSAAYDLASQKNFLIGMATSKDGLTWKKYNDPTTQEHPYAESDPVMMNGKPREWDGDGITLGFISKVKSGFEMYYTGFRMIDPHDFMSLIASIGYATSTDGIHWQKYSQNPLYQADDDPYFATLNTKTKIVQTPKLLYRDNQYFMYYDYGLGVGKISLAVAEVK